MTTGQNMPPGWYADPWAPSGIAGVWRYWDGAQWTGRTSIATTPDGPPPAAVAAPRRPAPTAPDGRPLAEWWQRLLGYVVDTLVFLPVALVFAIWVVVRLLQDPQLSRVLNSTDGSLTARDQQIVNDAAQDLVASALPFWIAMVALMAVYWIVCIGLWGRTIGGAALGIRAVTATGAVPGLWRATRRYAVILGCSLAGTLLSLVPVVGSTLGTLGSLLLLVCFLSMLWNPRRQAWQDLAAGTYVVRYRSR